MSRKDRRLQVLVPASLDARVERAAGRERLSKGEWVRRALERALDAEQLAADPLGDLASLAGPTGDIERMLAEIEAGRGDV
jgi:hypothetical protein